MASEAKACPTCGSRDRQRRAATVNVLMSGEPCRDRWHDATPQPAEKAGDKGSATATGYDASESGAGGPPPVARPEGRQTRQPSEQPAPGGFEEALNGLLRYGRPAPTMEGLPPGLQKHLDVVRAAHAEEVEGAKREGRAFGLLAIKFCDAHQDRFAGLPTDTIEGCQACEIDKARAAGVEQGRREAAALEAGREGME